MKTGFVTKQWSFLGGTEPNQKVNSENISQLPSGCVVRNGDGSRIIHLHDDIWLYCSDHFWCYDGVDRMKRCLDDKSVLCHHSKTGAP
jgi:hypothetical protein